MSTEFTATHHRWAAKITLNRDTRAPAYKEEWYWEQCGGCRFWIPVTGPLGADWGACSNAKSEFDAQLRFEHDGCAHFEEAPEGWCTPD